MRVLAFNGDNQITLLQSGSDYFPALIAAFDAATDEIYLETYIFTLDETGTLIANALQRAASRGVIVRIVADWLGTGHKTSNVLKSRFERAGVGYRIFNPWFSAGVVRTHRKMCVVDHQLAFVGGLNINDDLRDDSHPAVILPAPRWDLAVKITGSLVENIHLELETQWQRLGLLSLNARWEKFRKCRVGRAIVSGAPMLAALIVRDNLRNRRAIQRAYIQALNQAQHDAFLVNPYFAPGRKLRIALEKAARRGVKVTFLLGIGQFKIQDAVAHSYYPKLLKSGVKLVEYHRTQLHAKAAVVDDKWATVGSSNCDGLSLFVNQEANVVVKDKTLAAALRHCIQQAITEGGVAVNPEAFINIPWYRRAWYGAAYILYTVVLRTITLGKYA